MQARTGCSILTAAGLQVSPARPDASQMAPASCCRKETFRGFPGTGSLFTRMSGPFFFLLSLFLSACSNTTSSGNDFDDSSSSVPVSSSRLHSSSSFTPVSSSLRYSSSGSISSSAESSSSSWKDSLALQWIPISAGTWTRGVTDITQGLFKITQTEITQADYFAMLDTLPVQKVYGDALPVSNVTWYDAGLFCNALSKGLGMDTAYTYTSIGPGGVLVDVAVTYTTESIRLPTEAEWEYAARAGTTTSYYWGTATASLYAQYGSSAGSIKVASKRANAWKLYDMAGNVSEWCSDWYGVYANVAEATNPTGPALGSQRIFRGGSWSSSVSDLASDARNKALPELATDTRGFRVVHFLPYE